MAQLIDSITGDQSGITIAAYLRGTGAMAGINLSHDGAVYAGVNYDEALASIPTPSDSTGDDFGVQQDAGFQVEIIKPRPPLESPTFTIAQWNALRTTIIGSVWDLDLVSTRTPRNGSEQVMVDSRRATAKGVRISKFNIIVTFADVDADRLAQTWPSKTFSIADFPRAFTDVVGKPITDLGAGTHERVPLYLIDDNSGMGPWKYAINEARSGVTYGVVAIYRNGQVVNVSEYTTGNSTGAATGVIVTHVSFVREQRDFSRGAYKLEAKITANGSREPSAELARIFTLAGYTPDSSFTTATAVDTAAGILCDAGYVRPRTFMAIINDLCVMARANVIKGSAGAVRIVQDKARTTLATYREIDDLIEIASYELPEIPTETQVNYRATITGEDNAWQMAPKKLTTGGAGRSQIISLMYCFDEAVANKLCDYYDKRAKQWRSTFTVWASQWDPGDALTLDGISCWDGEKLFVPLSVARANNANQIEAREYSAALYAYPAGSASATPGNGYGPDYSQTPPAAPTGLAVFSQATAINTDGTVKAYALIRAVPPALNWTKLFALATNVATKEIYLTELKLNAGNYEGTLTNMSPGQAHTLVAYANNGNLDGAVATLGGGFTSAENVAAPAAPASALVAQVTGKQVQLIWAPVTVANIARYEIQRSDNAAAFQSYTPPRFIDGASMVDETTNYAVAYQYRIRAVDTSNNASAWTNSNTLTPAVNINSSNIIPAGVLGASIANGAINQARTDTSTGSVALTLGPGAQGDVNLPDYSFATSIALSSSLQAAREFTLKVAKTKTGAGSAPSFMVEASASNPSSGGVTVGYRTVT